MSANLAELTGIEVPTRLLIGGEWTGGRDGGTLPVIDPSTEDALTEVADGTVEENPRLCGWGAEIVSIVAEEAYGALTGPPVRITTPHIPLPAADKLEDYVLPSADRIVETVRKSLLAPGGTNPLGQAW